jgi:hypothetical protein
LNSHQAVEYSEKLGGIGAAHSPFRIARLTKKFNPDAQLGRT